MKLMRVTKKQVFKYIMETMNKFDSLIKFRDEVQSTISGLDEFPKHNANQIKFFIRVRNELDVMIQTPKVLRIPIATWYQERYDSHWNCYPFYNDSKEIPRPAETKYDVGDVVVIDDDDEICVGVVLGVIDNIHESLRTDARGMVCFSQIRHATMEDVNLYPDHSGVLKYLK